MWHVSPGGWRCPLDSQVTRGSILSLSAEDAEAMVSIDRPLPGTESVKVYELPSTQAAAVVHQGDFEEFTQGHAALLEWIDANG